MWVMNGNEYKLTYEESNSESQEAKVRLEAAYDFLFDQVLEELAKPEFAGVVPKPVEISRESESLTEASGEISLD